MIEEDWLRFTVSSVRKNSVLLMRRLVSFASTCKLHVLSPWVGENYLVLSQVMITAKSSHGHCQVK